jgi:hypothetical protein
MKEIVVYCRFGHCNYIHFTLGYACVYVTYVVLELAGWRRAHFNNSTIWNFRLLVGGFGNRTEELLEKISFMETMIFFYNFLAQRKYNY